VEAVAVTEQGALRGLRIGALLHFRGIRYASAPRFAEPAALAERWQGERDATRHGPICPQLPLPRGMVMGDPSPAEQGEDCLSLSVVTPAADAARRPVMVWLHGGAYVVGAGSYEWYRPDALVGEGDVVAVNVNYRLGVFGYLRMQGVCPGNLGLLDQLAALRWVRRNIAAFGGDPDNVTVFGQSAGGHSIVALMSIAESRGLFRRAIVQSAQLGLGFTTIKAAERVGRVMARSLHGLDPRDAVVEQLLSAQGAALIELAGPGGLNSAPPFGPIVGVPPLALRPARDVAGGIAHRQADLIIGSTREEMRAYFDVNPLLVRLRALPGAGAIVLRALTAGVTKAVFGEPARRLADAHARGGAASVYLYAFDWAPRTGGYGACHTIELPFVFGDAAAWRASPMLAGTPAADLEALGRAMRRAWTRFARHGDPNTSGEPEWPAHRPSAAPGRHFA
jgi:para-nitrobenzyl esterase